MGVPMTQWSPPLCAAVPLCSGGDCHNLLPPRRIQRSDEDRAARVEAVELAMHNEGDHPEQRQA
jgi:hypothetical protein